MPDLDPTSDDFYDLVVVGRGYSASTYLFTADLSWCKKILIIGGPDAWEHIVRGDGIVNHANYIYARDNPDKKIDAEAKIGAGNKEKLKDENAAILQKSIVWLKDQGTIVKDVPGITKTITKTPALLVKKDIARPTKSASLKIGDAANVYSITFDNWGQMPLGELKLDATKITTQTVQTLKVVYCGGAGPHRDDYGKDKNFPPATFLDLDSFMRSDLSGGDAPAKKLIVIGPNAGLDAAVEALERKFDLYWLISGPEGTKPVWLSTKHYFTSDASGDQLIEIANNCVVNYDRRKAELTYNKTPKKYEMNFKDGAIFGKIKAKSTKLEVDYVVYATGQDPHAEEMLEQTDTKHPWRIGPAKVLENILKNEKLTPIYDTNQRFGEWYETALGLKDQNQSSYTGLEVLGAAALALVNDRTTKNTEQAFFRGATTYTQSLDQSLQPATPIDDALAAIRTTSWYDDTRIKELYRYLKNQKYIPSVANSMAAILPKLYSQTLIAADQLGVIKSQIEAITGFDLIAASTPANEWIVKASAVQQASQQIKLAIESLPSEATADNLSPLKKAVEKYNAAKDSFGKVEYTVNETAAAYIALLSKDERETLQKDGFLPDCFARKLNFAVQMLSFYVNLLSSSDDHYLSQDCQQWVLEKIPAVQRQLTNLQAIFQASATGNIQSAINFNSMDRTQLAVLLSTQYPAILATDWRPITAQILEGRKVSPWGYTPEQVTKIETWLSNMNKGEKSVNEFPDLTV